MKIKLPEVKPLDCFVMLAELNKLGFSNAEVSRILGHRNPTTVQHWKEGAQPRYSERVRFVALYEQAIALNTPQRIGEAQQCSNP